MPKLLFNGTRADCVEVLSGTITDSNSYLSSGHVDAGINVGSGVCKGQLTDPASAPLMVPYAVEAGHFFCFHAYVAIDYFVGGTLRFFDSSGYPWLSYDFGGQWSYNSGTGAAPVWTNVGDNTYGSIGFQRNTAIMDMRLDINAEGNHTLAMAANSTQVQIPATFLQPLMTNISYWTLTAVNGTAVWSEILCTEDVSTIGAYVLGSRAVAPGTHADWSGSYTDVNETITNDATYNTATAENQIQTYQMGEVTIPAGSTIMGVMHYVRAQSDGVDPTTICAVMRTAAGVDQVTPNLGALPIGFAPLGVRYNVNPDTGLPFVQADWDNPIELGYKSAA
jgi:hypothetical protein